MQMSPSVGRPKEVCPTPPPHVTCDACWEGNPRPMDRQTPVKTLPCPKLRLRAVQIVGSLGTWLGGALDPSLQYFG